MPLRPLTVVNVEELNTVDDALFMLDTSIADLMVMSSDQLIWGNNEFAVLDRNTSVLKNYTDRIEELIRQEKK